MAADRPPALRRQYYFNPWWSESQTFFSDLPPAECRRVINESTTPFLGRIRRTFVSSADFTLHRMSFMRNSFRPYAYVAFSAAPSGGTIVKVTLSAARSVQLFFIVWFSFLAIWTGLGLWMVGQTGAADIPIPIIGIGMATFGFLLHVSGRIVASDEATFLLNFLRDELSLRPQR